MKRGKGLSTLKSSENPSSRADQYSSNRAHKTAPSLRGLAQMPGIIVLDSTVPCPKDKD